MQKNYRFLFNQKNYIIFFISLILICVGFILMIGGDEINNVSFNPKIFSFQRIVLAPMVIILGYVGMILSIFYND